MNVIVRANKERFEEAKDMCEALREIFAEDFERVRTEGLKAGMEEGLKEGKELGIKNMIESGKEFGASYEKVFELVQDKYNMSGEETEKYMELYW